MKWGLITDTHNKRELVREAIRIFASEGCDHVLHAGDFDSDATCKMFKKQPFTFLFVTDHKSHDARMKNRQDHLETKIGAYRVAMYHDTYQPIVEKGQPIGVRENILSKTYDFVFYGHLHYFNLKLPSAVNQTVAVNSGGFYYPDLSTFAILDIDMEFMDVYYWYNGAFAPIFKFPLLGDLGRFQTLEKAAAKAFVEALGRRRWESSDRWEYAFTNDEDDVWLCKSFDLFYEKVGLSKKPEFFY